jgi:cobaltochelatase CobN
MHGMAERLLEAAERKLWAEPNENTLNAVRSLYLQAEGDLEAGT